VFLHSFCSLILSMCGAEKYIALWNPRTVKQIAVVKGSFSHILPFPSSASLLTSSESVITLYEHRKGSFCKSLTLKSHADPVIYAEILNRSPRSKPLVVTVSSDGVVILWETQIWQCFRTFQVKRRLKGCCLTSDHLAVMKKNVRFSYHTLLHFLFFSLSLSLSLSQWMIPTQYRWWI